MENEYERGRRQVRERLTLEAAERTRGEELSAWLSAPETREAVLAGLLLRSSRPVAATTLYGLADPAEPSVARKALALAYRRSLTPPQVESLDRALGSPDPRVRVLATRLASLLPPAAAAPIRERSARDADPFVREAAAPVARQETAAAGGCPLPTPEPRGEIPGATLRAMTTPGFEGWPYVVYLPEDYRGDQPFPLLVYMSGGEGRALTGLGGAHEAFERTGYIVLMPQASDLWWTQRSLEIVSALLEETLRRFRIDADRVFVSGFSNGGSGTYHFATLLRDRFAAAVSLEGAGTSVALDAGPASNLHDLPFLFVHGDRDEVVPASASDRTVKAIRRATPEAPVELRILPGRVHDLTLGTDEGLGLRFLEGRRRDPFPRRVRFAWRDLRQPRSFWVEALDKDFGTGELEAEIEPDNTIRLRTQNIRRLRLLLRRELLPSPEAPLRVVWNDRPVFEAPFTEDCALFARTAAASADPRRAWSIEVTLDRPR
jgi:dienelactone hydrolase